MTTRRQATLYLPLPDSTAIESLRSRFNRVQFELIRAHVTIVHPRNGIVPILCLMRFPAN